jgi:hypothetical protein
MRTKCKYLGRVAVGGLIAAGLWMALAAPVGAQNPPDWAVEGADEWDFEDEGRTLVLFVEVVNFGGEAPETRLLVEGWDTSDAPVPPLASEESVTVEVRLPIPDELRGSTQTLSVVVDPDDEIEERVEQNNRAETPPIVLPEPEEEPEPPPGEPEGEIPPEEVPPEELIPPAEIPNLRPYIIGGGVVVALGAIGLGALIVTTLRGRSGRLSASARAELQSQAHEQEPPDECTPGIRYVRKIEVEVKPAAWEVAGLDMTLFNATTGKIGACHKAPQSVVSALNRAIRERRLGETGKAGDIVRAAARELSELIVGWQSRESHARDVSLDARLEGGEATFKFVVYRCQEGLPPRWQEGGKWTADLKALERHTGTLWGRQPREPYDTYLDRTGHQVRERLLELVEMAARL